MGAHECYLGLFVSSEHLDQAGYVTATCLTCYVAHSMDVGAAAFISSAGQHLPPSDIWCILYPSLRHFMKSDIVTIDEQSLLSTMKLPVSLFLVTFERSSPFVAASAANT